MTKFAITHEDNPIALGGKGFSIGVSCEAPWMVLVEFDGFPNEAEARAYAHRLQDHKIFVSTEDATPN